MFSALLNHPALKPLKQPVFGMLWSAWLIANLSMAMSDVASAWLMTTLTTSPAMVALVATASTLPVFLMGLPSGALADILDRRRYFAATQIWVSLTSILMAITAIAGLLTAPVLILLTFLNGIGLAMRWPVFAAIVPDIVNRDDLPQALALNAISMNLSRVIGPGVAGALIASLGGGTVFVLNAVMALVGFVLIMRWKAAPKKSALPGERFVGAMRVGLQHVRQSPRMRAVLFRIFIFFFQSTALMSLLPLIAKEMHGGGPAMFTLMLSAMGAGAVVAALYFPKFRERYTRDSFVRFGTIGHAVASATIVLIPEAWLSIPAMVFLGMAWISSANSLSISAQMALPNWVRARGMSVYQMSLMGGAAAGALLWGQVAEWTSIKAAVLAAATMGISLLLVTRKVTVDGGQQLDFTPAKSRSADEAAIHIEPDDGPIMVTVEYQIDVGRADEFAAVLEETRQARLRLGVLSWGLFKDVAVPGRYVEYFVDESWLEHQRRLERFTAADIELRNRRDAFQVSGDAPLVTRYVASS